ncbi:MAG TPA: polyribonucleotide nucleotidyltransferase [Candidatus Saccharimonadales bacterium]|nr:polyribonucleotide nucleotidyltransferase [Candidatus Saccharimonadales bacterium]
MASTINPFGKKIISVSGDFCGRKLTLETGRLAFQATSAVTVRYGDTVVEAIVSVGPPVPGLDFFPLSVDYEERFYAAGKISGSRFIKREGRPSEEAILAGRLIDRPIRPLFPKGYRDEVQAIAMVLSLDPELKSDIPAMIAVSTALKLSGAPFDGPVAGVRVGLVDGKLKAYPTALELADSDLDLTVAGTAGAIMMVEAGAGEVDESTMVSAIELAHKSIQPAIALQEELAKKVGTKARDYELALPDESVQKAVDKFLAGKLTDTRGNQEERGQKIDALKDQLTEHFRGELGEEADLTEYIEAFDSAIKKEVRRAILQDGLRPDNRKPDQIRTLSSEVGVLPRAHGSSIFTRGSTQALNVTTLAPLSYAQLVDTMEANEERRFFHHYNMPGYASGEIKRLGSPGRREIGHSALAQRALSAVIPDEKDFPYTIRTVTEIMSSNGSTSMAATCSGCLSLMDAGVPLKAPVSGIAMGLVTDPDSKKYVVLSDIAGAEDFAGDMDFKVAGTQKGITALQMDIKVHGITPEIMAKALAQAKGGRAEILRHMLSTLAGPRSEMSPYAPRVEAISINPDKIREVIGKGGETINKIVAETGAEIDIKDDGTVMIASPDKKSIDAAIQFIRHLTAEPEVGKIYEDCRVVSVLDFGAFVEILPGKEGLVHVSEMKEERVEKPSDVVKEGDKVTVKLVAIDDRGRLQLSMKAAQRELTKSSGSKN